MFTSLFLVFLLDALLVGLIVLAMTPLAIYRKAAFAVMKRNFVSYFTTPTGYVFLCLFVLLSSFAAFWPHEFWASNMATLDQLNFWIPLILLLFIPAITMGIWAEERRQGTDELLLTIPADDFDIVLGKYLAAASIFTASLLFSQLANFSVMNVVAEGGVDLGLFFTTYIGYWFMGMAMLSIGMVASFLTSNLTVGFILGAVFNAPLALANYADVIFADVDVARTISEWGMAAHFADFGRGMITISSTVYFTMIVVTGIYLSVVLIGRRHWLGGKDGRSMLGHYLVRAAALIVVAIAATAFFTNHDLRKDATSLRINELSPDSKKLLRNLNVERPVRVEAYISKSLPDEFVATRYDFINMLKEVQAVAGSAVQVAIHDSMEPLSKEAKAAEDQFGITPRVVQHESQGAFKTEEIFMAAAFSSGAEQKVVPFIGPGTPIEYELVRSITTVADEKKPEITKVANNEGAAAKEESSKKKRNRGRKTVGIMTTDAHLTEGFNPQTFSPFDEQLIVTELRRQYEVETVDPNTPVNKDEIDVLIVPQPSSLTPGQLPILLEAIRAGIPTAIFEDPFPAQFRGNPSAPIVPGTDDPKRAPGGMFGMQQGPQPKCDISQLWKLLGVHLLKAKTGQVKRATAEDRAESAANDEIEIMRLSDGREIVVKPDRKAGTMEVRVEWEPFTPVVFQEYNPYLKDPRIHSAAIFANPNAPGAEDAFNPEEPAVSGMHEVLLMAPGAFEEAKRKEPAARGLKFSPLITIGTASGLQSLRQQPSLDDPNTSILDRYTTRKATQSDAKTDTEWMDIAKLENLLLEDEPRIRTDRRYTLAAHITGKLDSKPTDEDDGGGEAEDEKAAAEKKEDEADPSAKQDDSQPQVNVMLIADIDLLSSFFVQLRNMPMGGIDFQFQNIPFVLNVIDALAGDERFLNIRKRTTHHAPLKLIEDRIRVAIEATREEEETFKDKLREEERTAQSSHSQNLADIEKQMEDLRANGKLTPELREELQSKMRQVTARNQRRLNEQGRKQESQLRAKQREIQRNLELERQQLQNQYKAWAVILPPIPPLLVGLAVFIRRRLREGEGVAATRRR